MMELGNSDDVTVKETDDVLKTNCLSAGTAGEDMSNQLAGLKLPVAENGFVCNLSVDIESSQVSCESSPSDTSERLPNVHTATGSSSVNTEDDRQAASECVNDRCSVIDGEDVDIPHGAPVSDTDGHEVECDQDLETGEKACGDTVDEDLQHSHDLMENEDGACKNLSPQSTHETSSQDATVARSGVESESLDNTCNVKSENKSKCDVPSLGSSVPILDMDVICLDEDGDTKDCDSSSTAMEGGDCQNINEMKRVSQKRGDENVGKGNKTTNIPKTAVTADSANDDDSIVYVHVDEDSRQSESQTNPARDQNSTDDEKENKETCKSSSDVKEVGAEWKKYPKMELSGKDVKMKDNDKQSDSADDEVEIIGETKVVQINKPNRSLHGSQNVVFVPEGLPLLSQSSVITSNGGQLLASTQSSTFVPGAIPSPAVLHNLPPGNSSQRMPMLKPNFVVAGGIPGQQQQQQQKVQLMFSGAPPKPQSSLDQIELIRWEIQNRINTRPKYFKPNPTSELGSLAKYLFDIGSDLIKEAVYHDLVKIQSKKKNENKLNDKEKEDLGKLKEIEKDLYATIGHLKLKLKKKCSMCDFRTESVNVMFQHNQYPHEDIKCMRCSHCSFITKQAIAYKFHMEAKHGIQPRLHDKKATFECELCPYENNHEQKLNLHKQRCIKQFRPYFNLHPSCLSGAEINLCLENIFYKPLVPKNLHLLQHKHAHLQAPMTDAQKQQAEIKSIAAQNTAAAIAAKKQLLQKGMPPGLGPRYSVPSNGRMPYPVMIAPRQQHPVRYSPAADTKGSRSTIASMLNNQQNSVPLPTIAPAPVPPPGAFEVCEVCGGFVKDRKALRIHFFYAHRIDLPFNLFERNQAPLYCATCYVRFWTAQGLRKHIDSHKEGNQSRGVVGKCILCSHHVLNLLLHMRLVHNRDMLHYINLNMCMFCGVKSASRQECQKHIATVHGQVDPVTGTLKQSSSAPNQLQKQQPQRTVPEQNKTGKNTVVKGCICVLCNLRFSRNVDLTRHCMRLHHTCMKCGMVVVDKASLQKHTCLLSSGGTRNCVVCGETGYHPAYYIKHLRDKHLRKLTIKVTRLSKKTVERWTKHPCPFTEPEDILVEISDDDDDARKQQKSSSAHTSENIPDNACADKLENNNKESVDIDDNGDKNRESVDVDSNDGKSRESVEIDSNDGKNKESMEIDRSDDKNKESVDIENDDKKKESVDVDSNDDDNKESMEIDSDDDKNNVAGKVAKRVEEVIDLDTREFSGDNEDSRSGESAQGHKRKSELSTSEETSPKRQKIP